MQEKNYYGLDIVKFISAFLVIAIHTAPLLEISERANFIFVQVIARIAVPFFFITSGFLFFRKVDMSREWNDYENIRYLKHYLFRIFRIYALWTIVYLPCNYLILQGDGGITFASILRYLRDVCFNGSYYHLWFLPALMFAVFAVYMLHSRFRLKTIMIISLILYLIGMLGNVYGNFLYDIPLISSVFHIYTKVFVTTRNGLFFGMIYIAMGACVASKTMLTPMKGRYLGFLLSIALLCVECYALRRLGIMHDLASMYLMLLPTVWFLFAIVISFMFEKHAIFYFLRAASLLIYTSHLLFIVVSNILFPELSNLYTYIVAAGGAFLFAVLIYALSKKIPFLRYVY